MASGFLDTLTLLLAYAIQKKMTTFISPCQYCSSKSLCSHREHRHSWKTDLAKLSLGTDEITEPERLLNKMNPTTSEVSAIADMNFIRCNFCHSDVVDKFITQHVERHVKINYVGSGDIHQSSPISQPRPMSFAKKEPEAPTEPVIESDVREFLNAMPLVKVKDYDSFSFREIKDISFCASVSKSGAVSDFSITVWFPETTSTYGGNWSGAHGSTYSKRSDRLQINICHDQVEDFFTLTGRCYGRTGYSEFDTDEGFIPMRVCEQKSLRSEIVGCLLFHRVSPKAFYHRLRKVMRKMSVVCLKDKSDNGYLATDNHKTLTESKTTTTSTGWDYTDYD